MKSEGVGLKSKGGCISAGVIVCIYVQWMSVVGYLQRPSSCVSF